MIRNSPGLRLSLLGLGVFLISLALLLVFDPIAALGMVAGGLMVLAGLLRTLRSRTEAERRGY